MRAILSSIILFENAFFVFVKHFGTIIIFAIENMRDENVNNSNVLLSESEADGTYNF